MAVIILAVAAGAALHRPPAPGNGIPKTSNPSLVDNSDAAIDQDVNNIDAQISGLASDESNTDQALGGFYK